MKTTTSSGCTRALSQTKRKFLLRSGLLVLFAAFIVGMIVYLDSKPVHLVAVLRVTRSPEETNDSFLCFQKTMAALLSADYIVEAALRDGDVKQLPWVANQPAGSRVSWLRSQLQARIATGTELVFVRIPLAREHELDQLAVLDAIVNSHLREVVSLEQLELVKLQRRIKQRHSRLVKSFQEKVDAMLVLRKQTAPQERPIAAINWDDPMFGSGELAARHADALAMRDGLRSLQAEIRKLDLLIDGPARVSVIQNATRSDQQDAASVAMEDY